MRMFRCVSITPRGVPVLPEVKMIVATDRGVGTLAGAVLIVTGCLIAARQRPDPIEATAV